ncbi:hypothetical protein [Burkholderia sp. TSV86]|uniref:hypothetical protein n=1 Tax=Burkholderia sp. TSV86 TaxID=1385594 RepID=UPI000A3FEA57|nr:hypothetical protein [Burkholderia sp. TSV86]
MKKADRKINGCDEWLMSSCEMTVFLKFWFKEGALCDQFERKACGKRTAPKFLTAISGPDFFGADGTWSSVNNYGWLIFGRLEITAQQNWYTSNRFETLHAQRT